jgi:succinate dehydrogenase / fumarate reductase flavoprotein subunit
MWNHAGILRNEDSLLTGLHQLQQLQEEARDLDVQSDRTTLRYENAQNVRCMLTTAETILRGALERTESRGAHARTDYLDKDPAWQQNIRYIPTGNGSMDVAIRSVDAPSAPVQRAIDEEHELDYHHLE